MRAHVNQTETYLVIEDALDIFQALVLQAEAQKESSRQAWIDDKVNRDWFRRSRDYWEKRSAGGDAFERYELNCTFEKGTNLSWAQHKLAAAQGMERKYRCARSDLQATQIILSDDEIALLSISLDVAKKALLTGAE